MDGKAAGGEASACGSCGTSVPDQASFCPGCGAAAPEGATASTGGAAHTSPALPGYTVLEPLGRGGSSVVYRARQDNLDRQVAVKLIRQELDDPRAWRRFEREARIIASLSGHRHVVTIYDVGRTEAGQPFLVTEWLDRGSLSDVLAQHGPLAVPAAVAVGRAVAEAVAAAHERGILHRDIKPGNVLLDTRGHIKLADFGIARLMAGHSQTTTAAIAFTPEHVAPEVLRGEEEGPSSDVYGLASTVVTALLGRSPFARRQDERVEALMWRKLAEPPPPLPPSVPPRLGRLLTQCLSIDPVDRPPLDVVRAVLAEEPGAEAAAAGPLAEPTLRRAAAVASGAGTADGTPSPSRPAVTIAPTPPPAEPLAGTEDSTSRRGGGRWVLLATIVVALVFAAGLLAIDRGSDRNSDEVDSALPVVTQGGADSATASGDGGAAPESDGAASEAPAPPASPGPEPTASTTVPTTVPETTVAPPTSPPTTTASPPPEQAAAGSEPAGRDDEVGRQEAIEFVRDYYERLAGGDLEAGWARLSPDFREARNLTFERYAKYWRNTSVELDKLRYEPGPGPDQARVRFDARYMTGGQVVEETDELTVRRDDDGLVITDQRIVP